MPVLVTRTMASVGSWIVGSGTVSTRTSRLPWYATAFMGPPRVSSSSAPGLPGKRPGLSAADPAWRERRQRRLAPGLQPLPHDAWIGFQARDARGFGRRAHGQQGGLQRAVRAMAVQQRVVLGQPARPVEIAPAHGL